MNTAGFKLGGALRGVWKVINSDHMESDWEQAEEYTRAAKGGVAVSAFRIITSVPGGRVCTGINKTMLCTHD